ncbi:aminomethyl transferase family protein [Roseobacter sp. SK209-2-6]|uniref:glycine cleavage T C-terminal barrel domain-containing protein n=1 Tax=Roseobacter sp. SK209-2-6 TaxID=388739 RepID=UPI0000F3C7EF|nr:glycine cleavage T C-terminal barrel domain-containing protein [Roseobacter sp. SK209-2-6]EBA18629.1 aminomethyl transferase family protein [Roseobacter sp. SK209-2-6]
MFTVFPNARIAPSPFYDACVAEGMVSASIYNSMVMPSSFGDKDAEYWRVIEGVSQWDVSVQRQVQLKGPDAAKLAQAISARDLSKCQIGQGKYAPVCNYKGTVINDPVVMKLDEDLFWLSIADSDIWLWSTAIGAERGLDVEICDPGVSPMALQGPRAEEVVADVLGEWVHNIRYFWFKETQVEGIPIVVQRAGYSKQGGFEIYLRDSSKGTALWNIFKEAGQPYGIGPGSPQTAERTESGLLSVGSDTDATTNPFEVRLGKFTDIDLEGDVVGLPALRQISEAGPKRHQLGLVLEGKDPAPLGFTWDEIYKDGAKVGDMTNCIWSPRMKANIGYALISADLMPGQEVAVVRNGVSVSANLVDLPFL